MTNRAYVLHVNCHLNDKMSWIKPDRKLTQLCLFKCQGDIGDVPNHKVPRPADRHQEVVDRRLDLVHDICDELRVLDVVLVGADGPVGVGERPVDQGPVVGVVEEAEAVLGGPGHRAVDHRIPLGWRDRVPA